MGTLGNSLRTLRAYPGYVLMRSVARIESVRTTIAQIQRSMRAPLARYLRSVEGRRSAFFPAVDPGAIAADVERDGFALGLTLPTSAVQELVQFAASSPCWADRNPALGFLPARLDEARQTLGRSFLLAQYLNARWRSPLIARLAEDPALLGIAARYLGTSPKLVGVNMWWSYPAEASAADRSYAAQLFHYDLDDFKFIKFFFYLTDVDSTAGPHVMVRGSHREKRHASFADAWKVRRYSDEEVIRAFGADRIISITGPAGTGFAEDTLCIHKGVTPTGRARLLLQFQYALNDFGIQHDDVDESRLAMIV